jgi:hypothetical protein
LESQNGHHRLAVQNYMRRFFDKLARWQRDPVWFAVAEPTAYGQLHVHWVCWAPNVPTGVMRDIWKSKYGHAKVGPYSPGASVYTAKTLGHTDLHALGGRWRAE